MYTNSGIEKWTVAYLKVYYVGETIAWSYIIDKYSASLKKKVVKL